MSLIQIRIINLKRYKTTSIFNVPDVAETLSTFHDKCVVVRIKSGGIINRCKKSLTIPKGGNQNPFIENEHTTQWPQDK
jgi:hypothetical protein